MNPPEILIKKANTNTAFGIKNNTVGFRFGWLVCGLANIVDFVVQAQLKDTLSPTLDNRLSGYDGSERRHTPEMDLPPPKGRRCISERGEAGPPE